MPRNLRRLNELFPAELLVLLQLSLFSLVAAAGLSCLSLRSLVRFLSRYAENRLLRLKARGEPAQLLIGVNKEASVLQAHAWIEAQGTVVGDSAAMAGRFATLLRF